MLVESPGSPRALGVRGMGEMPFLRWRRRWWPPSTTPPGSGSTNPPDPRGWSPNFAATEWGRERAERGDPREGVLTSPQSPSYSNSQDLHEFVPAYAAAFPEDVLQFTDPVSPIEDITAIVWELARQNRAELLVFNKVDQLGVEVVTNMFASRTRIARLVGAELADLHSTYDAKARNLLEPRTLSDGPVLEQVAGAGEVDLTTLPLLTHFSSDKAPYITSGVVIVEDSNGAGNMSYHRAMVHSPTTLATSLHSRGHLWRRMMVAAEEGGSSPVVLVIGGHPLFLLAASARVPADVDERHVAGGLMGAPLDVVRTPLLGFRVPATADFVLEGFIDPKREVEERPFGEFTGYSSDRSTHTLMRVETVLQRTNPMLAGRGGGQLGRTSQPVADTEGIGDGAEAQGSIPFGHSGSLPQLRHSFPLLRERPPTPSR